MTPHEIFQSASRPLVSSIFNHLQEEQKALYKATIEALAKQRKLRGIFVERKPKEERHAWMHDALSRKTSESLAAQLLQIWLVGAQSKLLCDFLDGLGIKHDKDGTVEELPSAPAKETLKPVIESLLTKYDREVVAVYLHAFQALGDTGWTSLDEILKSEPSLQLPAAGA